MKRMLFIRTLIVFGIGLLLQTNSDTAAQSKKGVPLATESKKEFGILEGRWLRPDGGYIIQIRGIDSSGKMDSGYFNPRPINGSRAEGKRESGKMKVFVELSDVGYPGSTYTLTYDPKDDVLRGVYYQAAARQNFDVYFPRTK